MTRMDILQELREFSVHRSNGQEKREETRSYARVWYASHNAVSKFMRIPFQSILAGHIFWVIAVRGHSARASGLLGL
jgi:hypothetical protein